MVWHSDLSGDSLQRFDPTNGVVIQTVPPLTLLARNRMSQFQTATMTVASSPFKGYLGWTNKSGKIRARQIDVAVADPCRMRCQITNLS